MPSMVLLATGILTFGSQGWRSECQIKRPSVFLIVDSCPLDERDMSLAFCPLIEHVILYL